MVIIYRLQYHQIVGSSGGELRRKQTSLWGKALILTLMWCSILHCNWRNSYFLPLGTSGIEEFADNANYVCERLRIGSYWHPSWYRLPSQKLTALRLLRRGDNMQTALHEYLHSIQNACAYMCNGGLVNSTLGFESFNAESICLFRMVLLASIDARNFKSIYLTHIIFNIWVSLSAWLQVRVNLLVKLCSSCEWKFLALYQARSYSSKRNLGLTSSANRIVKCLQKESVKFSNYTEYWTVRS